MMKMEFILMNDKNNPRYFSVDIESSGPVPGFYSMLSFGVCLVETPDINFYRELKPLTLHHDPEALSVTGFDLYHLMNTGIDALTAMKDLSVWVEELSGDGRKAVFAGFNAAFDWSFINWYFHYTAIKNPFGYVPLDIKSLFKGVCGLPWQEARTSVAAAHYGIKRGREHHALDDAIFQAAILQAILNDKGVR
ncbi:3'-5' exoribonuclease domain-containing protein [Escherichia coli]|uniref:3'-5' exonuclease n=2 Tax=Enterobacteriaceae TaxID=543 RepID=UPI001D0F3249|nr:MULTISPECIES: 3'-5' exoribonuclease [Enterobacteriaceae]MCD9721023.1 3'-5' exonuclease [Klebsiella pneumoniae]MCX2318228.1 3'-5' exonuclease [Klebsiella quasipneumoniae]MDH5021988.1 3'-5' exonuclease [Enterobacter asburiae]MDV0602263.1 3'-5' exonuclease [Raoultella ornithinolytica]